MSGSPHLDRRTSRALSTTRAARAARATAAALGVAGLAVLGAAPVAVAEDGGAELVVGGVGPVDGAEPGSTFDVPVTVGNRGTEAAGRVWVTYSVTRGLDYASVPSNCVTYEVPTYDEMTAKWTAVCEFDQSIRPGDVYAPEQAMAVKVLKRALHDDMRVWVSDTEPTPDDAATPPVRGTAPAVRLVEEPGADAGTDSATDARVTSVNTAGFKVTGARVKGRVGDTVPFEVSFANSGPAWVKHDAETSIVTVLVTPPAGTSIVRPDGFCHAKDAGYACGTSQRWVNESGGETYTFQLKIDKKVAGAKGSVALADGSRPFDPDKADDRADITLDVTGGGSTGDSDDATSGSEGTSPNGSGNGGELADTGSSGTTLSLAGVAVAATVVGTGAAVLGRRRTARESRG